MSRMHGIVIRSTCREAHRLEALVSPTRDFRQAGDQTYVMEASDEVQALRDADFLASCGAQIVRVF